MDLVSQLKKSDLFFSIDDTGIERLVDHLNPTITTYEKGEYIAFEGDELNGKFGIILKGSIEVMLESAAGIKTIINILSEGELIAEVAAFAKKPKWPASAMAIEGTVIAFFTSDSLLNRCNTPCSFHTELISNMLKILASRALYLNKKVQYLTAKGIKEKIALYLLEQYNANYKNRTFMIPLSRVQMADFLNITRPSLSREMAILKDEGIIDYHRNSIKIINLEALSNILK